MKIGDTIQTERLVLRHWDRSIDGAAFHRQTSDPEILRFFPTRRTRAESDDLLNVLAQKLENDGFGTCAITLGDSGEVIGWGGLAAVHDDMPPGPATEIGWRFSPEHWGKGYATEMALACRDYAFETLGVDELIAFAVADNHPSTAVMNRIGMKHQPARDFDHPRVPDDRPDLKYHVLWSINRAEWLRLTRP